MNIHKVTSSIVKPRDLIMISNVTLPKYEVTKGNGRHKIINMQKLWRREYNFNVNKDQLPMLASTTVAMSTLNTCDIVVDSSDWIPGHGWIWYFLWFHTYDNTNKSLWLLVNSKFKMAAFETSINHIN